MSAIINKDSQRTERLLVAKSFRPDFASHCGDKLSKALDNLNYTIKDIASSLELDCTPEELEEIEQAMIDDCSAYINKLTPPTPM